MSVPLIRPVVSPIVPAPVGPYSQGIVVAGLLFLAGQGPFDKDGIRVGDTITEQARHTFDNIAAMAEAAGTAISHAVRFGVFLSNMDDFEAVNAVMAEYVADPAPVRTTIPASLRGFDIEVEAVIAVPRGAV